MTSYFDELTRQVSFASVERSNEATFIGKVDEIELRTRRAVEAVAKLPGFPEDLRDKIARAIERSTTERAQNYRLLMRSSEMVNDLHSIFHEIASRKIQTQFGVLSDDPVGTLKRLSANGKDAFEEHIDTCEECDIRRSLNLTGFCDAGEALAKQWSVVNDLMAEGVPPEEYPK